MGSEDTENIATASLSMELFLARMLAWVDIPFERSSQPRNRTQVSCIAGRFFTIWATREAHLLVEEMDPQAKSYGPVILDASRLGKQNMLENKRFWLVIITYFRVVLFHKVWWMGFEKGNIHFTPLHKYNYYNHRWQRYLNIKSESEEMWVTRLEVARTGRWKHRYARSTGQRNGQSWTSYWALTSQPKWKRVTRQQAFIFRERVKVCYMLRSRKAFVAQSSYKEKRKHLLQRRRHIPTCSGCTGTPHFIVPPRCCVCC